MTSIHFLTGNAGKVASANRNFEGTGISIVQKNVDLIEPQADTLDEVALAKAQQAMALVEGAFIVVDSGLVVPGLNGFPGVYAKYCVQTIKAEGLLALVNALTPNDRTAHFQSVMVYRDGAGKIHTFTDRFEGSIATQLYHRQTKGNWSDFYRAFIPKGHGQTLSELSEHEVPKEWPQACPVSIWDKLKSKVLKGE